MSVSLYVHVPFCKAKCNYCDFNSYSNQFDYVNAYFVCLKNELKSYFETFKSEKIDTVFFGGGTPTVIDSDLICDFLEQISKTCTISDATEISIEANPGTIEEKYLKQLRVSGFNRLSLGAQSFDNKMLKSLGRIHSTEQIFTSFDNARTAGFDNINIDVMFGLPNQTILDHQNTLISLKKLNPEHISCYSLTIEEQTPIALQLANKQFDLPNADAEREMYYLTKDYLAKLGYNHYEISNWAKPGLECKHNLVYWNCKPYIGLGAGAHSYFQNFRYSNACKIFEYLDTDFSKCRNDAELINQSLQMKEFAMLQFRLINGISCKEFHTRFGFEFEQAFANEISDVLSNKLIQKNGDNYQLTSKGLDFANLVFQQFV